MATAADAGHSEPRPPATDPAAPAEVTSDQATELITSRRFVVVLVLVSVVGVVVSFATWGFLELIYQIDRELYTHLPSALGYHNGPPRWWPLPILAIAGVIVGAAIQYLPGRGGHIPAKGLARGDPAQPVELPGIVLAGLVGVSFGIVLGPEAPLLALGPGLAMLIVKLVRPDAPRQLLMLAGAAGAFSAISFLFVSPVIAAILMIEVTGLGGARLPLVLVPGLLAAGIGSLLAIGMGSWTGLNRSAIALGPIQHLPAFARPTVAQFGWTIALAIVVAIVAHLIMQSGLFTYRFTDPRPLLLLPVIGLVVAGLAIAFSEATGKSMNEVLFSGESALPSLISTAGVWSLGTLALLLVFKGLAYGLSLGSFRGGPTFPAIFLGAAGGLLASHLPGFAVTPAVAVGIGAATAAVLKLPLTAIVLATILTSPAGSAQEPLIIVGVVAAYIVTLALSKLVSRASATEAPEREPSRASQPHTPVPAAPR